MSKRVVSGIQTSGSLHLGNYLGSIKNWVTLQDEYQSFLFLADLHSITVPQKKEQLQQSILEVTAAYLASGIDPEKAVIFQQSSVSQHAELGWILSCMTPMGFMNRMTQFKDKAGDDKERASLGLYSYPVLMAADILLYKPEIVPVGEDQKQHLELTRYIAESFNRYTNTDYFPIPETKLMDIATRVMSLRDGTKKMSKSDPSDYSRINLLDDADLIATKIRKAKSGSGENICYDKENMPEISNLLSIYSALSERSINDITEKYAGKGFAEFKRNLTDLVVEKIVPISDEMHKLIDDKSYILSVLQQGANRASETASKNYQKVKELVGFVC